VALVINIVYLHRLWQGSGISDKHCVLTQIMTGQCTLQIECVGIVFFVKNASQFIEKISNDVCTHLKGVSHVSYTNVL
jgi:hypothetical protein